MQCRWAFSSTTQPMAVPRPLTPTRVPPRVAPGREQSTYCVQVCEAAGSGGQPEPRSWVATVRRARAGRGGAAERGHTSGWARRAVTVGLRGGTASTTRGEPHEKKAKNGLSRETNARRRRPSSGGRPPAPRLARAAAPLGLAAAAERLAGGGAARPRATGHPPVAPHPHAAAGPHAGASRSEGGVPRGDGSATGAPAQAPSRWARGRAGPRSRQCDCSGAAPGGTLGQDNRKSRLSYGNYIAATMYWV